MSNTERRIIAAEVRAVGTGSAMRVCGMAARYNVPTKINSKVGKFVERIMRGAFSRALDSKQDVAFLINHDPNRLMARVSSGTLRLRDTDEGLAFDADFDEESDDARNAYRSIQRGDMHGCSFGFDPDCESEWDQSEDPEDRSRKMARRTIRSFKTVNDVSAVTFPAYPGTKVVARSVEQRSEIEIPEQFLVIPEPVKTSVETIARRRRVFDIISRY